MVRGGAQHGRRVREQRPRRHGASRPRERGGTDSALPKALRRPYPIVAFDWDGTAVMSREEDATAVRELLERLLQQGVAVVVITGTKLQHVERQLSAISGPHKRRLYVCANRGSEVYSFDEASRPTLLWRREATPDENRKLTEIADVLRDTIRHKTGLDVEVVYGRLNRRKVDLIPEPEWRSPPKWAIGRLMQAVEARLRTAGLEGGLREAVDLARRMAREKGLPDARITTDGKYVEVGLTDKGDSIDWVMENLARPAGLLPGDVLVSGDEFGPVDGFPGSDYLMVTPQSAGAVFVSVGPEPNGVPPGVIHLGGGPTAFQRLLAEQVRAHEARATSHQPAAKPVRRQEQSTALPSTDETVGVDTTEANWALAESGFNPAREHEVESLFTVGNGYLGTRGSLPEGSPFSRPATFIAGAYTSKVGPGAWNSAPVPELAPAPDWARLEVVVEGRELRLDEGEIVDHHRVLDLERGVFRREWRQRDAEGRVTRVSYLRFASLADQHAVVESMIVSPENYSGRLAILALLDGRGPLVRNGAQAEGLEVATEVRVETVDGTPVVVMHPSGSPVRQAFAVESLFRAERFADNVAPTRRPVEEDGLLGDRWEWEAEIGQSYRVDKLMAVYTSRDVSEPARSAAEHLRELTAKGVEELLAAHEQAWRARWEAADVKVEGDGDAQTALRFAAYHLISAANPSDPRVSVAARDLTGEAYKGHVFWDTEIYMLPFYVHAYPTAARAVLTYRYNTLPAARRKAHEYGYRGALYAWESADTGEDVTPRYAISLQGEIVPILTGEQAHHISADVAYAVWRYWQATGDDAFLREAGAEILVETARFWASRVVRGDDGLYHIQKVVGPDEYHEGVDDNAFTNGLARWNLERAAEAVELLQRRWPSSGLALADSIGLGAQEPEEWLTIAAKLYTGFDPSTGLFEQFRGYFALEEVDLAALEPRMASMDVLLGREGIAASKVIKQPDVVMLLYLLWDQLPADAREANFRYYEPRCSHGSSLSPSIHALVAARLGDLRLAERYFRQSAEVDLANNMGNAALGVHMAAQGGLWQAAVFGLAGLAPSDDTFTLDPHLLPGWRSMRFPVQWRGRTLLVSIQQQPPVAEVALLAGGPLRIVVAQAPEREIGPGESYRARRVNSTWRSETGAKEAPR